MSFTCPCIEAIKETPWFQPLTLIGATGWFLGRVADWYGHIQLGAGLDIIGLFALFGAGFLALKTLEHFDLNEYLESHPESLHESTSETQ
ncbi:hypothetical protein A4G99_16080 [Haladaptatus sp. R4]|uniref:hypothetical protein n=1 Tax=Haladaptatus sp. R4 TaxID=1679489 RepID=UPI0007B4C683|nr:hypothetical protein [Haladaptatus sp. R4]KZN23037.1 hypothetical protein A4G99_16080 [Haladaptatus sp. R4]